MFYHDSTIISRRSQGFSKCSSEDSFQGNSKDCFKDCSKDCSRNSSVDAAVLATRLSRWPSPPAGQDTTGQASVHPVSTRPIRRFPAPFPTKHNTHKAKYSHTPGGQMRASSTSHFRFPCDTFVVALVTADVTPYPSCVQSFSLNLGF